MPNITVSYADMDRAAARLATGRDELTHTLHALQQQIQGLVHSGFVTDHASIKFDEAYGEYTESATTVVAKLGDIQAFLTQAAQAVRDMDMQIASRIGA